MKKSNFSSERLKTQSRKLLISILPSIMAIFAGILIGFIILLLVNPGQALSGLRTILIGSFYKGTKSMGNAFYIATPIILTGLSVGFAFKTGLFNIGASGQFFVGSFCAIYVGYTWTWIPSSIHWLVVLLAGLVGGAIWGILPGLLKAYFNVNEVITCIMMNYIGLFGVMYMIKNSDVYNVSQNRTKILPTSADLPKLGLDKIFPYQSMNCGILIAIVFVLIIFVVLNKTTFGFELKACGFNPDASKYAGINSKRNVILSMVIAGALSGVGGALLMQSGSFIDVVDVLPSYGFDGMSVALLAMSNPIGILFSGLFIAHITIGGIYLQRLSYDTQIINIITAAIIYFAALALLFDIIIKKLFKDKKEKNSNDEDDQGAALAAIAAVNKKILASNANSGETVKIKDDSDKPAEVKSAAPAAKKANANNSNKKKGGKRK